MSLVVRLLPNLRFQEKRRVGPTWLLTDSVSKYYFSKTWGRPSGYSSNAKLMSGPSR